MVSTNSNLKRIAINTMETPAVTINQCIDKINIINNNILVTIYKILLYFLKRNIKNKIKLNLV